MTKKEFFEKYNIHFENASSELIFLISLDNLYVQFTKEQVLEIIADYYDHANDIFNDTKEILMESISELTKMFGTGEEDNTEEQEIIDKKHLN